MRRVLLDGGKKGKCMLGVGTGDEKRRKMMKNVRERKKMMNYVRSQKKKLPMTLTYDPHIKMVSIVRHHDDVGEKHPIRCTVCT